MQKKIKHSFMSLLMIAGCTIAATAGAAEDVMVKDPARWSMEDTTPQARYRTMQKEANAAYRENVAQCKIAAGSERSACMKEAKANLQQELANAKQALKR